MRDWLNANRGAGARPLPGAAAINDDHDAYLGIARAIVADLRLDPHDDLPHRDYLNVVGLALPRLEMARAGAVGIGRKR